MAEHDEGETLFARLMALTRAAFAAGHYDTAYHTLVAALQEAEDDPQRLRTLHQVAAEQLAAIDALHPEYPQSTQAAKRRGHTSVLATLIYLAHTKLLRSQQPHPGETGHAAPPQQS
jgi:hypothetical protein